MHSLEYSHWFISELFMCIIPIKSYMKDECIHRSILTYSYNGRASECIHRSSLTHSYQGCSCVSFLLILTWRMNTLIEPSWLIHIRNMAISCESRDSFAWGMWHIHACILTRHSYWYLDSLTYTRTHIHIHTRTHTYTVERVPLVERNRNQIVP